MASVLWFLLAFGLPSGEPVSFYIETIEITGARYTGKQILLSQARLAEETRYSENELRAAIVRIKQLPFVRQASFSLRRGSQRGHYKLVIQVQENSLFFYDLTYESKYAEDRDNDPVESLVYHAGVRSFLGKSGLAYATYLPERDRYIGGFTHFNVARRGIFFNLEAAYSEPDIMLFDNAVSHTGPFWRIDLVLAFPIQENQWFRLERSNGISKSDTEFFSPFGDVRKDHTSETNATELYWEYNTTDDPLFPSRGSIFRLGIEQNVNDTKDVSIEPDEVDVRERRSITTRPFLDAEQTYSLGFGHSLNLRLNAAQFAQQSSSAYRIDQLRLAAGYRYDWFKGSGYKNLGDIYTGIEARYYYTKLSTKVGGESITEKVDAYTFEAYLVHRMRWGLLRGSVRYQGGGL